MPGKPAGRRERKKMEVHAHILREARELVQRQGFWATSVQQIAAAADVAPATFFNHFPNKAALLRELASDLFDQCITAIGEARHVPGTTEERLGLVLERAARAVLLAHEALPTQLLSVVRLAAVTESQHDQRARLQRAFSALLYDGQQSGDVRRDIDSSFLGEIVVGVFLTAILSWLNDPRFPLVARLQQTSAFICSAVCVQANGATAHKLPE